MKEGGNNTQLFHNFANHRRNLNKISIIKDMDGVMASSFKEKTKAREKFFKNIFKEPEGCYI